MRGKICLVLLTFVCLSCSAPRIHSYTRGPASIEQFPAIPAVAFSPSISFASFLEQANSLRKSKSKVNPSDYAIYEHGDFYDQLNAQYEDVLAGVQKLLHNPNVPAPALVILKDAEANAQVPGTQACLKVKSRIKGGYAESRIEDMPAISLVPYSVSGFRGMDIERSTKMYANLSSPVEDFLFAEPSQTQCAVLEEDGSSQLAEDLAKHWLDYQGTLCKPNPNDSTLTYDCPKTSANYSYQSVAFQRALPFITVNAGLIAAMSSFEEFRAVVAHELGHYYLGHLYTMTTPRNYFYNRSAQTEAFRPPEDPKLIETGNMLLAIGDLRPGRSIAGMFRHPMTGEILLSATRNFALHKSSSRIPWTYDKKKCSAFLKERTKLSDAERFLYSANVSEADEKKWESYFLELQECTKTVVSVRGQDNNYLRYFSETPPKLQLMDFVLRGYKAPSAKNAWDAFVQMEPYIVDQLKRVADHDVLRSIGYYTFEEEADIFAVNYLMSYGYSPAALQSALANLSRSQIQSRGGKRIGEEECLTAYEHGWMKNGAPYVPLPLTYKDLHHGFCFRLYDVDNLTKRLGVYTPAVKTSIQSSAEYSAIRDYYRQLVAALPKTGG